MKREELEALGLTKEQMEGVMRAHGVDIEATRRAAEENQRQAEELRSQLAAAAASLSAAQKDTNELDGLRRQLQEAQNALTEQRKTSAIRDALAAYRPRDAALVAKLLNAEQISYSAEGGELTGLKEQMEALKSASGYLFEDAADPRGGSPDAGNAGSGTFDMNQFLRG